MESKHRFPQSLENAEAFPTFPPPDRDYTHAQQKGNYKCRQRKKHLTPIRRMYFTSAALLVHEILVAKRE